MLPSMEQVLYSSRAGRCVHRVGALPSQIQQQQPRRLAQPSKTSACSLQAETNTCTICSRDDYRIMGCWRWRRIFSGAAEWSACIQPWFLPIRAPVDISANHEHGLTMDRLCDSKKATGKKREEQAPTRRVGRSTHSRPAANNPRTRRVMIHVCTNVRGGQTQVGKNRLERLTERQKRTMCKRIDAWKRMPSDLHAAESS